MQRNYIDLVLMSEKIFRIFLDILKDELKALKVNDITNIQSLILLNIAKEKLTVGDIINKKYYIGSNVSYNLKKMIDNNYVEQKRSGYDKRSIYISLTKKGLDLYSKFEDIIKVHSKKMEKLDLNEANLSNIENNLKHFEKSLTNIFEKSI